MKILTLLLTIITFSFSALAQNSELELRKMYLEGLRHHKAGDYAQSFYLFNQVADKNIALSNTFDRYYAEALIKVGFFSVGQRTIDRYLETTHLDEEVVSHLYNLHREAQQLKKKPFSTKIFFSPDSYYEGEVLDGVFHGHGTFVFENGEYYEGEWKNGKMHGEGEYYWIDWSNYYGNFDNGKMNGKGNLFWVEFQVLYSGDFLQNKVTGRGKLNDTHSEYIFEGSFRNSQRNGHGTFRDTIQKKAWGGIWKDDHLIDLQRYERLTTKRYPDGSYYEGMMSNDLRHGPGKFTDSRGTTIEIEWKEDKPGSGKCKIMSGDLSYEGNCTNGYIDGKGQFEDKSAKRKIIANFRMVPSLAYMLLDIQGVGELIADEFTFKGTFAYGRMKNGTQTFKNGTIYTGDFLSEKFHGKGYLQANGYSFRGEFNNGKMKNGTIQYANGNRYVGSLDENEKAHGKGEYSFKDGSRFVGEHSHGWRVQGAFYFSGGHKYLGGFLDNKFSGKGAYYFSKTDYYKGDFQDGYFQGKGALYHNHMMVYRGDFYKDKYHGYGWSYDSNGQVEWKGEWINGKKGKRCRVGCKKPPL